MIATGAQAALTILFGALAGGVTNTLAIWMLFHPYEPPRILGRPIRALQGAIPKNKARLAATIGRTVGTRLLTPDDLANVVSEPAFQTAFDERLSRFLHDTLDQPRGSLEETLPAPLLQELSTLLEETAELLVGRLDEFLASDAFHTLTLRWATTIADEIADRPLSELLTPEREEALTQAADQWIENAVEATGFERAIEDAVDRSAERFLAPDRTFQELLPAGLVTTVEAAISAYLPVALEHLSRLLEDPGARKRVERLLSELLERFMRDLRFHQRLVASLLITSETVDGVLRAVEEEGAEKLSELLQEDEMRTAMARGVNDAIVDFLRRPITSVLGHTGEPSVEEAKASITDAILAFARTPRTREFLVERLRTTLSSLDERTWGDLFRHVPPDRIAGVLANAARSEQARRFYEESADRVVRHLLERPIGRVADHLPDDAVERIQRAISGPLWSWIQGQVPELAQRVDIERQIEQKILDFPMTRVEEIIRGVTDRELRVIVRLGYLLGAMIGFGSALLNLLLR